MSTTLALDTRTWVPATILPFPRIKRRRRSQRGTPRPEPIVRGGGEIINLADILERAIERQLDAAMQCDVRLHCCCLDELPVHGAEVAMLAEIGTMLAGAMSNAVWGSRVACEADIQNGRAVLRIWFARPATHNGSNDWAIEDREIVSSWPIAPAGT